MIESILPFFTTLMEITRTILLGVFMLIMILIVLCFAGISVFYPALSTILCFFTMFLFVLLYMVYEMSGF